MVIDRFVSDSVGLEYAPLRSWWLTGDFNTLAHIASTEGTMNPESDPNEVTPQLTPLTDPRAFSVSQKR